MAKESLRNMETYAKADRTALMQAVMESNKELVSELIQTEADVNVRDGSGGTSIMYAVRDDHKDLCFSVKTGRGGSERAGQ